MNKTIATRSLLITCLVVVGLAAARPALGQNGPRLIGGGFGYAFDQHEDFPVVSGIGWIPFQGPDILFKPLVAVPRVQVIPGISRWQVDLDAVWDIPVAPELIVRPYMGLGVGLVHDPGDTTPVVNLNAGFRIKKPEWDHQFAAEIHYTAGLGFRNQMTMNFVVMFPFRKR